MALDGVVLHRIVSEIQGELPIKVNRITQASDHEFLLNGFNGKKVNLFISTHPNFARIQLTQEKSSTNLDQTHILMVLRKHFAGGIITAIEQKGFDRILTITVEHRNEMGVINNNKIIMEFIGKSANMILCSEDLTILDANRRNSGFESNQRSIHPGSLYEFPEAFDKKSFNELETMNKDMLLRSQFDGISPVLEREILHRLESGQDILAIKEEILSSQSLYVYAKDYHVIELRHMNASSKVFPINDGLDYFYKDLQAQARIKDHTGDLLKLVNRESKRALSKLPKLEDDLVKAQDCEHLREYGDLLFAFGYQAEAGAKSITLDDFEGNELTIELDPRFSAKENAKRYFKKYNKAKTSIQYLEKQIEDTKNRIAYFDVLKTQIQQASVEDAQEISQELIEQGILNQKKVRKNQSKKRKNNYIHIAFDDVTDIYVGKNNLQNDTITFKLARKDDIWFHAANMAGAHVLLKTDHMDEEKQRLCCQLAAYFSAGRHSSSVEVHYTQVRNIKKVAKGPLGLVALSTQKSMFIDPDEDYLLTYLNQ